MKVIVAGSRLITDYSVVKPILDQLHNQIKISEVISGKAPGIDSLGETWAQHNKIPVQEFPADWEKYGRATAGTIRNKQMALYAQAHRGGLCLIWNGISTGSANMKMWARKFNLHLYEYRV